MDQEIDVPPFFLCPISLEIMKDPVTISTGITYDRESIEKWLFSNKNTTCPVTKQPLAIFDSDLTPNHTLRRLIQSWCTMNASHGVERIPTPKPPISKIQIIKLLNEAKKASSPLSQLKCLQTVRSIASENETNKRCIETAGAAQFLASIVTSSISSAQHEDQSRDVGSDFSRSAHEALSILYTLQLSETSLKSLLVNYNGEFIDSLTKVIQRGSYESRAYAVMLLKAMFEVADPAHLISLKPEFFTEIIQVLNDQISHQASTSALQILIQLCPWGRNRVKAVVANGVSVLVELLLDCSEKRVLEMALVALDLLCGCAEGRAELLGHGAGLAILSKKILRVSQSGSERAVRILYSVSRFSGSSNVVQDMLQLGVAAKLCLLLQVDCGYKTKERAKEILKMHARVWRSSSCIPANLLSSYPV